MGHLANLVITWIELLATNTKFNKPNYFQIQPKYPNQIITKYPKYTKSPNQISPNQINYPNHINKNSITHFNKFIFRCLNHRLVRTVLNKNTKNQLMYKLFFAIVAFEIMSKNLKFQHSFRFVDFKWMKIFVVVRINEGLNQKNLFRYNLFK